MLPRMKSHRMLAWLRSPLVMRPMESSVPKDLAMRAEKARAMKKRVPPPIPLRLGLKSVDIALTVKNWIEDRNRGFPGVKSTIGFAQQSVAPCNGCWPDDDHDCNQIPGLRALAGPPIRFPEHSS